MACLSHEGLTVLTSSIYSTGKIISGIISLQNVKSMPNIIFSLKKKKKKKKKLLNNIFNSKSKTMV